MINLRKDAQYSIMVPTSMGVRITPVGRLPVHVADTFHMQVTSAETNVVSPISFLGHKAKVLTALVEGSPIARKIADDLALRHIDVEAKHIVPEDAWGARHQFNVADAGFGVRGPRVYNDRAGEAGRMLGPGDFDTERIFGREGVRILHLSGLVAALSESTTALCVELAEAAHKHGTIVSFDLNYRASFWKGREEQLRTAFRRIASLADILVGNEEDFQLALGLPGPDAGGEGLRGKLSQFHQMIERAAVEFPNFKLCATTLREVVHAGEHLWGAVVSAGGKRYEIEPQAVPVYDRIGGGDGFVGGLLYGVLEGWDAEKALQFGWATGALAVSSHTDFAQPISEDEIWNIWNRDARVKR